MCCRTRAILRGRTVRYLMVRFAPSAGWCTRRKGNSGHFVEKSTGTAGTPFLGRPEIPDFGRAHLYDLAYRDSSL